MSEKRFTYDSKTVSILKDGEFWLDGNVDTACNHSEICQELNELAEENKLHKERISLLSSLLDLADAIIDTSDNEKAKKVWSNKNEETEKEWEKILNDKE